MRRGKEIAQCCVTPMSQAAAADVFTATELARAAGVSRDLVDAAIASGSLRRIPGTSYFSAADALRAAVTLRAVAASVAVDESPLFSTLPDSGSADLSEASAGHPRLRLLLSSSVHGVVIAVLLWAMAGPAAGTNVVIPADPARLVFLMTPGPGGGGGGGGLRERQPAARVARPGRDAGRVTVPRVEPKPVITAPQQPEPAVKPTPAVLPEPKPIERAPDPVPVAAVVAPVVAAAADTSNREGVVDQPQNTASQGTGAGGGAGSGQGTGNGEGLGNGIGEGSGGGTGGGPYRPGSGIEPPRLLREVKATYTEDARRRGISGDVELEIVVTRDGGVRDVRVLKGLGSGLDERAIAAVRQWRFSPARRLGVPVDVIVEVGVEFTLR
jgi:TonB family protein